MKDSQTALQRLDGAPRWRKKPEALSTRFGIIYSPKATQNIGKPPLRAFDSPCAEPTTKLELADTLRDFHRRGVGVVAVSGGDGTLRDVLTALPEAFGDEQPMVALLPAGRTDAVAADIGVYRREDELPRLLAAAKNGTLTRVRRPCLRANRVLDEDGRVHSVRGILMGGAGFVYATELAQGGVHATGASHTRAVTMTAVEMVRRLLTQPNPGGLKQGFPISMRIDGAADDAGPDAYRSFFLASGLRGGFLIGKSPFVDLDQDPELLHLIDVRGPTEGVLRAFGSMMINKPWLAGPKWKTGTARSVKLEGLSHIVVDGEVFETLKGDVLEISADAPITFVKP